MIPAMETDPAQSADATGIAPLRRASAPVRPANDPVAAARPRRPAITVAAIIERDGRFLMVEEQTRDGLRLNQPAGHVEVGESIAAAAARETLEESAWRVQPTALVGVYHWQSPHRDTFVRFTFAAQAQTYEPSRALDVGIVRIHWLAYDDIAARQPLLRSPFVLRSLDDYRAGRRWPLALISTL
jgi:8-oxo-dGTP pyrophosphatase MutT (NUDIX family)